MAKGPKITFIGAGSTIFTRNIIGDLLHRPALKEAHLALMDIDEGRLADSAIVAKRLCEAFNASATVETSTDQRAALEGADFVVVSFQIGGYDPCTITDFELPKRFGLRQTIADTLGIGGIMRGLRTVPHLWSICSDMEEVCPHALMLQYVNPMAINTWAITAKHPRIRQVGLCHSVQGTAWELARDLDLDVRSVRYRAAGINHMAFYLDLQQVQPDGSFRDLYPDLKAGFLSGRIPKPSHWNPRCPNKVRYEMMMHLGYFVTESSEHFAEYTPWFIKRDRPDLIERFGIPLDEYPKRCEEQIADWEGQISELKQGAMTIPEPSYEYASDIINAQWSGEPAVIYGNIGNHGYIPQLPNGCAVEVPCLVDRNGVQPTQVSDIPPQLIALMRTNINVQELTVRALLDEERDFVYHAAMLDPHTAAELDLDQIRELVDQLLVAHHDWLPGWLSSQA